MPNVSTRITAQKNVTTSTSQAIVPSMLGAIVEFKMHRLDVQVPFLDEFTDRPFIMVATDHRTGKVLSQSVHCAHVDGRDSVELLDKAIQALMKSGKHISKALVDVGSAFRTPRFVKACREHGIMPCLAAPRAMCRSEGYVSSLARFLSDAGNYYAPDVCTLNDVVHTYADEIYDV